jgi:hypothetical protein
MLGAELSEAYPVVPVAEDHALSIGMFSYRDSMFFGLYSPCRRRSGCLRC